MIGPEQFGVFTSMMSLVVIFSGVAYSLQTIMTRYVAMLALEKQYGTIRRYFFKSFKLLLYFGLGFFVLILIISPLMNNFLNLNAYFPIIIMGAIVSISIISTPSLGVLQGNQNFKLFSLLSVIAPSARFIFGILFILAGMGVSGALGSSAISGILVLMLSIFFVNKLNRLNETKNSVNFGRESVYKYSSYVLLSTFLLLVVMNIDMVFVKHYFSSNDAGIYGSIITIGKIILYFPLPMSIVLFPKTAGIGKINNVTAKVFFKSLLITFLLCLLVDIIYFLKPELVIMLMFGKNFLPAVPYIGYYGLVATFLSVLQIESTYLLSVSSKILLPILTFIALSQLILFNIFTANLFAFIIILLLISFVATMILLTFIIIKLLKVKHQIR
jgi:O-antigen/teichoic acid export membrane protein